MKKNTKENLTAFAATYYYLRNGATYDFNSVTIWAENIKEAHIMAAEIAEEVEKPFCSKHNLELADYMKLEEEFV